MQLTIDVDDPNNVVVKKGNTYGETDIVLTKGVNTIDIVLGKTPNIFVKLAGGATLVSFVDNSDVDYSSYVPDGVNVYSPKAIAVAAGQAFTIRTKGLERDRKCAIYIEGNAALSNGGNVTRAARNNSLRSEVVTLGKNEKDGYTVVEFAESEAMFGFSFNGVNGVVYINDTVYAASTMSFYQKLNDGDVVKAYFGASPDTVTVNLGVSDVVAGDGAVMAALGTGIAIKKDIITDVDYMSMFAGIDVLTGTQIDITLGAESGLVIGYNGSVFAPDAEGVCHVTAVVDGDMTIMKESEGGATALQEIVGGMKATKVVRDGRVIIIRGEEMFDILGNAVVK